VTVPNLTALGTGFSDFASLVEQEAREFVVGGAQIAAAGRRKKRREAE